MSKIGLAEKPILTGQNAWRPLTEVNTAPAFVGTRADMTAAELTLLTVVNKATDVDQLTNGLTYE